MFYPIDIAGVKRNLPLCRLNDDLQIAAFVVFGDAELTVACAQELLKIAPDYDYLITAEAKGIPIAHEIARQNGEEKYFVARKKPKLYMTEVFDVTVQSITTEGEQHLFLDKADADLMRGKRILLVDDVISTGKSLEALEALVDKAGGIVCGRICVLAEGDATKRTDIKYLAPLPLFDSEGNALSF
ncbi:MAG: adenine phosphoribosyltransferase [Burkholderiaceae bacterium]|nr:adenine phosphoribosyltransferase [Burkholderiaceae bacterium]